MGADAQESDENTMDFTEAKLAARNGAAISLVTPDSTGQWRVRHPCWIEDDRLVCAHPTQPTGTVSAPDDGKYSLD